MKSRSESKTKNKSKKKKTTKLSEYVKCKSCSSFLKRKDLAQHVCRPLKDKDLLEICDSDVYEACQKLRRLSEAFGPQKIYSSAKAIMFSVSKCYMFVRPKRKYLEISIFLDRTLNPSLIKKSMVVSKNKFCHVIQVTHEDSLEGDLMNWIKEAYELSKDNVKTKS